MIPRLPTLIGFAVLCSVAACGGKAEIEPGTPLYTKHACSQFETVCWTVGVDTADVRVGDPFSLLIRLTNYGRQSTSIRNAAIAIVSRIDASAGLRNGMLVRAPDQPQDMAEYRLPLDRLAPGESRQLALPLRALGTGYAMSVVSLELNTGERVELIHRALMVKPAPTDLDDLALASAAPAR